MNKYDSLPIAMETGNSYLREITVCLDPLSFQKDFVQYLMESLVFYILVTIYPSNLA